MKNSQLKLIVTRCIYIKNTNRLKYYGYGDRNREAMRPGERNRERGRVRDISGQYRRRALTPKILASLNR